MPKSIPTAILVWELWHQERLVYQELYSSQKQALAAIKALKEAYRRELGGYEIMVRADLFDC